MSFTQQILCEELKWYVENILWMVFKLISNRCFKIKYGNNWRILQIGLFHRNVTQLQISRIKFLEGIDYKNYVKRNIIEATNEYQENVMFDNAHCP